MKKVFLFLFTSSLLIACDSNHHNSLNLLKTLEQNFNINKFSGNEAAYVDVQKNLNLISDELLIKSFNIYSKKIGLNKVAITSELIDNENNFYLRFHNSDNSASTVALVENVSNNLKTNETTNRFMMLGGTTCISSSCSHCCGCLPNGDYCTNCERWNPDCTRSTTGGVFLKETPDEY